MSSTPPAPPDQVEQAPSQYGVVAACSLALVALALSQLGLSLLMALVTVLIGLFGILIRWRLAVLVQLGVLGVVFSFVSRYGFRYGRNVDAIELLLAASTLCYCVSQYRLLGLTVGIFPRTRRRRTGLPRKPRPQPIRRPGHLFQPREIALLLVTLPGCVILAQYLWRALDEAQFHWQVQNPGFGEPFWHLIILVWSAGLLLALVSAAFGWWGMRHMTRDEARLILQDTVWNETRREQRYIQRWFVWSRRRRQRREEKP